MIAGDTIQHGSLTIKLIHKGHMLHKVHKVHMLHKVHKGLRGFNVVGYEAAP